MRSSHRMIEFWFGTITSHPRYLYSLVCVEPDRKLKIDFLMSRLDQFEMVLTGNERSQIQVVNIVDPDETVHYVNNTLRKLGHAIYRFFFSEEKKVKISFEKKQNKNKKKNKNK